MILLLIVIVFYLYNQKETFLMAGMDVTDLPPTFSYVEPQGVTPDTYVKDWSDYDPYPPSIMNMWDTTNKRMRSLLA
jgi:hypothetical protein